VQEGASKMKLAPQTGNEQMDEAYQRMQVHVDKCNSFEQFHNYFNQVLKSNDKEKLNTWLLKVIYVHLKQPKHEFDQMLELLEKNEPEKVQRLKVWLSNSLFEAKEGGAK